MLRSARTGVLVFAVGLTGVPGTAVAGVFDAGSSARWSDDDTQDRYQGYPEPWAPDAAPVVVTPEGVFVASRPAMLAVPALGGLALVRHSRDA